MSKFNIGDPVMLNPKAFPDKRICVDSGELTEMQAKTLLPPQSYVGTIIDIYGGNEKAIIVKWDHLGDDGHLFFEDELMSA